LKIYEGVLDPKKMPSEARKAYNSYKSQKQRCTNPKNKKFKYNGAMGISVCYGPREFIGWWLEQQELLNLKDPTCGRVDHDKNYDFSNIRLEERSDNTRERNKRCRYNLSKKVLWTGADGEKITFHSIRSASKRLGLRESTLRRWLKEGRKEFRGQIFETCED
jgi:hypothetical protein